MCQIGRGRVVGGGSLHSESDHGCNDHGCNHYLFNAEADFFIPTLDRAPYLDNVGFLAERDIFYFLCIYVRVLAKMFWLNTNGYIGGYISYGQWPDRVRINGQTVEYRHQKN